MLGESRLSVVDSSGWTPDNSSFSELALVWPEELQLVRLDSGLSSSSSSSADSCSNLTWAAERLPAVAPAEGAGVAAFSLSMGVEVTVDD